MASYETPPVKVAGTCMTTRGLRQVQATADLRCRPDLHGGQRLLRVVEARLYSRAPEVGPGRLRARFLLEFRYDAVRPDGARVGRRHRVPLTLTAALPADWTGPARVDGTRTRLTGAAVSLDRAFLQAGVQLSVRFG